MTYTEAIRSAVRCQANHGWVDIEIRWTPRFNADGDFTGANFDARPASVPYSTGEELFHVLDEEAITMLAPVINDPTADPAEVDRYLTVVLETARTETDRLRERNEE